MKKILYGVCGIGNGHIYRQLPTLNHLALSHRIMIFAYGDSLTLFSTHFAGHANVKVVEVAVPYYVGNRTGIDFQASAKLIEESGIDYAAMNSHAMHEAWQYVGQADLAISDYEPVTAQYAYAYGVPLVTIDQQSKYLSGAFPAELHGSTYVDEVVRLRMFFPTAAARIACSFFNVPQLPDHETVHLYPPVIRSDFKLHRTRKHNELLVYLTAQPGSKQSPAALMAVLGRQRDTVFHVFLSKTARLQTEVPKNVRLYQHGGKEFKLLLETCAGVIATAGHSLLSEAMYLGVPVLALPLPLYEQQMNAEIIQQGQFGLSADLLTPDVLQEFITNLARYAHNIKTDTTLLLRGDGQQDILAFIQDRFLEK
ncbi:MAG TPA: glycosyltransferase family protein [Candidatus Saccharimonadales bacterium]|nr:glycosyltransferase family protein [Candidatus Saccharimonadales bacterium]